MKAFYLLFTLLFSLTAFAQKNTALPHGATFGTKPDTTAMVTTARLEAFMAQKTRISVTVRGKVIKVTKQKGGWFDLDAGNGKVISAHFKNYDIKIPTELKGHTVIVEGVAQKQFIADDMQHFAGNTAKGKKQHSVKTNPKRRLIFEATGLMVE
jgi:hypothetical protein